MITLLAVDDWQQWVCGHILGVGDVMRDASRTFHPDLIPSSQIHNVLFIGVGRFMLCGMRGCRHNPTEADDDLAYRSKDDDRLVIMTWNRDQQHKRGRAHGNRLDVAAEMSKPCAFAGKKAGKKTKGVSIRSRPDVLNQG